MGVVIVVDRQHKGCYGKMVDHRMEKEGRIGQ